MSVTKDLNVSVDTVPPSHAVVERVAALEGVEQTELTPLYGAIDPEALNTLVETGSNSDSALQIGFTYHGYDVTVTGNGTVYIDEDVA